jgi:HD-GYP domain-containing protein (c-di-GMP phosphodiesterase class II)
MTDTQVLLGKIAALRQRLEQAEGLAREAGSAAAALQGRPRNEGGRVWKLERRVASGSDHAALLDGALRQLADASPEGEGAPPLPQQLTARARRVLERSRDLLEQLKTLADAFLSTPTRAIPADDPLTAFYRGTCAMTETVLRIVQAFPDSASVQLRLCEGVETIASVVAQRLATLELAVQQRRREADRLETLAGLLSRLADRQPVDVQPFIALAEAMLAEADTAPFRILEESPEQPARFTAAHSLTVAQVVARIVKHDPDLRTRPMEPVLAALVHDVGMLHVPVELLTHPGPLNEGERRAIEKHTQMSADLAARLLPGGAWLAEAAGGHHERLDGTGYPAGLRASHIGPLTRLLAVCDVYASLCAARPHRPARESRTALADTLLLADQGALDPREAERLLVLSFYPVGSVVELADGAVGLIVATHMARRDLNTPARPVVALLTDGQGHPLPAMHIDLSLCEGRSIIRTLPAAERRNVLGGRYPELA